MSEMITNSMLSKMTKINLDKTKRFALDFLGSDPQATQHSGKARRYSMEDAFVVFLGAHLISWLKYPTKQAVRIVADLKPWLISRGIFPNSQREVESFEWPVKLYEIEIWEDAEGEFSYEAVGYILQKSRTPAPRDDAENSRQNPWRDEYFTIPIGEEAPGSENYRFLAKRLCVSHLWFAFQSFLKEKKPS